MRQPTQVPEEQCGVAGVLEQSLSVVQPAPPSVDEDEQVPFEHVSPVAQSSLLMQPDEPVDFGTQQAVEPQIADSHSSPELQCTSPVGHAGVAVLEHAASCSMQTPLMRIPMSCDLLGDAFTSDSDLPEPPRSTEMAGGRAHAGRRRRVRERSVSSLRKSESTRIRQSTSRKT